MKALRFKNGRVYGSENDFFAYVEKNKRTGDYYRDDSGEISYYNSFGCLLARYYQFFRFGIIY